MAEIYYLPFAPQNNLSPVADAHVCASVPNFLALEFHGYGDPIWNDVIISDEPAIQEGRGGLATTIHQAGGDLEGRYAVLRDDGGNTAAKLQGHRSTVLPIPPT
jgi:hypothetical protein